MSECDVERKALSLSEQYPAELNGDDFGKELQHLLSVHKANFVNAVKAIKSVELVNRIQTW